MFLSNHRWPSVLIVAAITITAATCSKSEGTQQASAPGSSQTEASAKPSKGGKHAHAAPHGGVVESTSGGHIELVAARDGTFKVWLLDEDQRPRSVSGASVAIKVAVKGYSDVVPSVVDDHFEGTGETIASEHVTAMVTANVGDLKETARFELHLESAPASGSDGHGDHGHTGGH